MFKRKVCKLKYSKILSSCNRDYCTAKNITRVASALIKTDSTSSFTIISIVALINSSFNFSL